MNGGIFALPENADCLFLSPSQTAPWLKLVSFFYFYFYFYLSSTSEKQKIVCRSKFSPLLDVAGSTLNVHIHCFVRERRGRLRCERSECLVWACSFLSASSILLFMDWRVQYVCANGEVL